MKKAKIGLILDDKLQSWNIKDLIEKSLESNVYEISCIIVQKNISITNSSFIKKINEYFFKFISFFERKFVQRYIDVSTFFKKHSIDSFGIKIIEVSPNVSKSGFIYRYNDEDLNKIKEEGLDILIRGGSGILRGDILNLCRGGIISFHHGDNEVNRGTPPGFWEVYNREKTTGFIIQILNEELDAGKVLFKGKIPTSFFYTLNMVRLYLKANIFMHIVLEKIFENKKINTYPKKPYDKPLYLIPSLKHQLIYLFQTWLYLLKKIVRRLQRKKLLWNVAYQYVDDWKDVSLRKSKIIPNPINSFIADPFLFRFEEKDFCFVEEYDFKSNKGHISAYEFSNQEESFLGTVIKEDFHMSYPNVFKHNGDIYMIPETSAAKEIRLYICEEFPMKWRYKKTLISNVSAVDSNIFYLNNYWWLLTNIDSSNSGDHCSELHAFYSEDLLTNEWKPHLKNPLVFDPLRARNAGMIFEDGSIYRSYQIQGWDKYGEGFGIAKILTLDKENFKEKVEFEVSSDYFKNSIGTHTYNFKNGIMVTDFLSIKNK